VSYSRATGLIEGFRLRIVLHDYAGHPFQIQLSRELARRGYDVHHVYFADDVTPRGALDRHPGDPAGLTIKGLTIEGRFDKFSYWKRLRYERAYGARAARYVNEVDPDILINTNVPVDALAVLRQRCARPGRQHIVWLQDVVSVGVTAVLRRKLPMAGWLIGRRYQALERVNLHSADHVICIRHPWTSCAPLPASGAGPGSRGSRASGWCSIRARSASSTTRSSCSRPQGSSRAARTSPSW
jgi:colanic acid biosynthesis glycosyl transferase WcaI